MKHSNQIADGKTVSEASEVSAAANADQTLRLAIFLTQFLRDGAQKLLQAAIQVEDDVQQF